MDERNVIVEAFTELAPNYENAVDQELRLFWGVGYADFVERLLESVHIAKDDLVLDVATGTAVIPRRLVAEGCDARRMVGLDITPAMLAQARGRVMQQQGTAAIGLVCGSGMTMPLRNDAFDVVICGLGTHHMDVEHLMTEVRRVLKPGGRFVMADVRATAFWRSPLGSILLRALISFYSWHLRRNRRDDGIQAVGLSMSETRAAAEIEAFKSILTTTEWCNLLARLGFEHIESIELSALRRIYPGGLILTAQARQGRTHAQHTLLSTQG